MSLGALKASSIASARDVEANKRIEIFCISLNFSSLGDARRRFLSPFHYESGRAERVAKRRKNFNFVEVRLHLNNKNKKNAFLFCIVFDLH